MDAQDVPAVIDRILVDEFELDAEDVVPDARLREDLDLDSLDAVDMVVLLEKNLGARVDDKVVARLRTVGHVHAYVGCLVASGPEAAARLADEIAPPPPEAVAPANGTPPPASLARDSG